MKINNVEENLFVYRNTKDLDVYKLENNIFKNPKYMNTLNESDINLSAENIINIILGEYNLLVPPKKSKLKTMKRIIYPNQQIY